MNTTAIKKKNTSPPKVKIGASRQIAIPKKVYEELRLNPGDYLEMEVRNEKIILTPKTFIEKGIVEGLLDIKKGKVSGPFDSVDDLMKSLDA